jgi:hypothetical protein
MQPLRIGLLLDGPSLANWQLQIVKQLQASDRVKVVAAIINQTPPKPTKSFLLHLWQMRAKLIWKLHESIDKKLFKVQVDASTRHSIAELLSQIEVVYVTPKKTKYCDYLLAIDFEKIKSLKLDVSIRFGFRIIKGEFLNIAKFGIWSFHHADNRVNRGGPPGYWELFSGIGTTGITLQILNADLDGGLVLSRSICGNQGISITRNRNNIFLRSVPMMLEKLSQLHDLGWEKFVAQHQGGNVDVYSAPLYQTPDNFPALRNLIYSLKRGFRATYRRLLYKHQWTILIGEQPAGKNSLRKFKALTPPAYEYWADPFLVERNGRLRIFFEAVPFDTYKGYIAAIEYADGTWKNFQKVMAPNHHLSFPFLFDFDGRLLMVPESISQSHLQFFECVEFPNKWEPLEEANVDIPGIDTVIFHHKEHWYLFTTVIETSGAATNEVLSLYFTDNPLKGKWHQHPLSPLFRDVTKGRMAGRIFEIEGKIFRPAQNGAGSYGSAVNIYEITSLSPTDYSEKWVAEVGPYWKPNLTKLHTWNVYENFTVADTMQLIPRFL